MIEMIISRSDKNLYDEREKRMGRLRVVGPVKKSKREKVQSCAIEREGTKDARLSSFGKRVREGEGEGETNN